MGLSITPDDGQPQVVDMRQVKRRRWPHWTALCANTWELAASDGRRDVRVQCFERLEPSDVNGTQLTASYVPSHRNIFDVFVLNARLPLSGDLSSQIENLGGHLVYRPEGLLFAGGKPMSQSTAAPNTDHVLINVYVQTQGPGGQPLLTLDRIAAAADHVSETGEGRLVRERGEYIAPDGQVREALEVCWESVMGHPYPFPDPPAVDGMVKFSLASYPWRESGCGPGVKVKEIAAFGDIGPSFSFVKLEAGAEVAARRLHKHTFAAVIAGRISNKVLNLDSSHVMLASPGDEISSLRADQPTLLWLVDWNAAAAVQALPTAPNVPKGI
jgi:hypothetical protein